VKLLKGPEAAQEKDVRFLKKHVHSSYHQVRQEYPPYNPGGIHLGGYQ
jgi:hypothetical protein